MLAILIALSAIYVVVAYFTFAAFIGLSVIKRIIFGLIWPVMILIGITVFVYDLCNPSDD